MTERDEHIAFQRRLIADMNLVEHRDRLLTDIVMVDGVTGEALNRGQVFDRHAMLMTVLDERGAL